MMMMMMTMTMTMTTTIDNGDNDNDDDDGQAWSLSHLEIVPNHSIPLRSNGGQSASKAHFMTLN